MADESDSHDSWPTPKGEPPTEEVAAPTSESTPSRHPEEEPVPDRIGPYRILEKIGEGGFGLVYLADQTEPVRRRVAIKILKLGMDSRRVVARFEAEQQALALMDHPNVARVYDAGVTDRGRPYFVMEHVPGEKITRHCDRNRLGVNQRLALFLSVCAAVQHAHQKGIIHRDIKPSNILVTFRDQQPIPKVIDFGVAKALTQRLTDKTLYTELGKFIGTPEYMSPEQAEKSPEDVDTRSDVYSLGVLLYELLTGSLPFESKSLRQGGVAEIQRILREEEPPRPSTRLVTQGDDATTTAHRRHTDSRTLRLELRGDLDWIVMKAIEKDRARRYDTAVGLAMDIRRHMRHEPVLARPPSFAYRLKKFVRRNRVAVTGAGLVAATLVLGLAVATVGFLQASRERNRAVGAEEVARREAARATAVSNFLHEMLASADPAIARGRELTVRDVLDQAADRLDESFDGQPDVRASLQRTVGSAYLALGNYDVAEAQVDKALAACREALGDDHPTTLRVRSTLASVHRSRGLLGQAEDEYRSILTAQQAVVGEDHTDTLDTMNNLAWTLNGRGKLAEAEELFRRVVELRTRVSGADHPETLRATISLENVLVQQGKLEAAEKLAADTAIASRRALGDDHPVTLYALGVRAWVLQLLGDLEGSERIRREVLRNSRAVHGEEHPRTLATMGYLAWLLMERGKLEEAEALCREALEIQERLLGEEHPDTLEAMHTLATVLGTRGKPEEAGPLHRRVWEIRVRVLGEDHPRTLQSMNNLGVFLMGHGEDGEAAELLERTLELHVRRYGDDHRETLNVLNNLGLVRVNEERFEEAIRIFTELVETRARVLGEDHLGTIAARGNLGYALGQAGREEEAIVLHRQVFAHKVENLGMEHEDTLGSALNVASVLLELGEAAEAERVISNAFDASRRAEGVSDDRRARIAAVLGEARTALGRYEEAEPHLLQAHAELSRLWGADSVAAGWVAGLLADHYDAWGRPDEAAQWRARETD
jgi:serine/threonine protein kinase/Tfp pilus assembly protein PilF